MANRLQSTKHVFVNIARVLRNNLLLTIGFFASLAVQILGLFIGYTFTYYDEVIHFFMPAFGAPLLFIAIAKASVQRQLSGSIAEIVFATFLFGTAAAVLWEVFEFAIDPFTPHTPWQPSNLDTMVDLIVGMAGSIAGGVFLALRRRDYL